MIAPLMVVVIVLAGVGTLFLYLLETRQVVFTKEVVTDAQYRSLEAAHNLSQAARTAERQMFEEALRQALTRDASARG